MARLAVPLVMLLAAAWPAAAAPDSASAFIGELARTSFARLTEEGLAEDERERRFRELLVESFAVRGVARFILGRYWRRAGEAQREEFIDLLVKTVAGTWARRFEGVSIDDFVITGESAVRGGRDGVTNAIVRTTFGGTGHRLEINWRVAGRDGIYKITDIHVEGVSMITTYRDEVGTVIRRAGGSIEALLDEMRRRLEISGALP